MIDNELAKKLERAFALQQSNQVEAAITLFQEVLTGSPNQPDALHGIGLAYAQQQCFQQAANYLQQAVQAAPSIAEFHNNLGNALKAIKNIDGALQHYHEALRLKPDYAQAHNNLGTLLYRLAKFDQACAHFQKALRIDPQAVDTHYNLANCYIQQDRLLDAVAHYTEVLKFRPDHLGTLHNLGITLCALKRFHEASPLLEQAIQREPDNIDALFHLGITRSAAGKTPEAIQCYEQILKINPNHAESHHNLAIAFLQQQQRNQALTHYQAAFKLDPHNKTAEHMIRALTGQPQAEGAPIEYTRALFDQYAYTYDEHMKEQLQYQVPYLLREAITPFIPQGPANWTALDLGCGTGLCAPLFADVVTKLHGVDVSPNMIEIARQRGGYEKLVVADILAFLAHPTEQYDLILCADVFVYFGELDKVFSACYSTLKSNGLFCFSIETLTQEEISHSDLKNFQLRKTGRYAHNPLYIEKLCSMGFFKKEIERAEVIRYQEDMQMLGNIYILRKN